MEILRKEEKQANIKSIFQYLLLAYGLTWLIWLPGILATAGFLANIPWPPLFGLGACGPLAAALWLTWREGGWAEVKSWLKAGFTARVKPVWWLLILTVPFLVPPLALGLDRLAGGAHEDLLLLEQPLIILPAMVLMLTIGGAQEEYGWRGYLLPRLDKVAKSWLADLLLILLHVCWHLPLFAIAYTVQYQYSFWLFLAFGIGFTPLINMIYRNSGGSILAALIFHGLVNTGMEIFPPVGPAVNSSLLPLLIVGILYGIIAVVLTLVTQNKPSMRKSR